MSTRAQTTNPVRKRIPSPAKKARQPERVQGETAGPDAVKPTAYSGTQGCCWCLEGSAVIALERRPFCVTCASRVLLLNPAILRGFRASLRRMVRILEPARPRRDKTGQLVTPRPRTKQPFLEVVDDLLGRAAVWWISDRVLFLKEAAAALHVTAAPPPQVGWVMLQRGEEGEPGTFRKIPSLTLTVLRPVSFPTLGGGMVEVAEAFRKHAAKEEVRRAKEKAKAQRAKPRGAERLESHRQPTPVPAI